MRIKRKENPKDREIRQLAGKIASPAVLNAVVSAAEPQLRMAVFEKIRPHLRLKVVPTDLACFNEDLGSEPFECQSPSTTTG